MGSTPAWTPIAAMIITALFIKIVFEWGEKRK